MSLRPPTVPASSPKVHGGPQPPAKRETRPGWTLGGKLLVRLSGPILLVVLLWHFDGSATLSRLARVELGTIAGCVVLLMTTTALKAYRWRALLAAEHIQASIARAVLTYAVAIAAGALTPGRIGELYRAWPVSREAAVPVERVLPSVLIDRVFDQYVLCALGLLGLSALPAGAPGLVLGAVSIAVLTLLATLIAARPRTAVALERRQWRRAGEVLRGMQRLRWPTLARSFLWTLLAYAAFFTQCVLLARDVGIQSSAATVIGASALGNLAALLPVTLFGAGTREATLVAVLAPAGIAPEVALAYSLLLASVSYGTALVSGLVAWMLEGRAGGRFVAEFAPADSDGS